MARARWMKNDKVVAAHIVEHLQTHYEVCRFYNLATRGNCALTFFALRKHVTKHISISPHPVHISGVCASYTVLDSGTLFLGYLFETPKKNTRQTPISLAIRMPPEQELYQEVQLLPKCGILAYRSPNSSTLIIAQDELDLHYAVKDSQL